MVYTILNCYSYHVAIAQILLYVLKEMVHTGRKITDRISGVRGNNRRSINCVPVALNRLYILIIVSSISNLRAMVIVYKVREYVL